MYNDPPNYTTGTTQQWSSPTQPRPAAAYPSPSPQIAPPPAMPGAPQHADPSCVVRGTVREIVDGRTVDLTGEPVETATLLLETGPGRVIPIQLWGSKKIQYVRDGLGRLADVVFTVSCQQRQVTLRTGEPTTIYNAGLKLKSCLWA